MILHVLDAVIRWSGRIDDYIDDYIEWYVEWYIRNHGLSKTVDQCDVFHDCKVQLVLIYLLYCSLIGCVFCYERTVLTTDDASSKPLLAAPPSPLPRAFGSLGATTNRCNVHGDQSRLLTI